MILSDTEILRARKNNDIIITPFDYRALGGNSYDVHLSPYLARYKLDANVEALDVKQSPEVEEWTIDDSGFLLQPQQLYLASTIEYTATYKHVPYLDGKSSTGRLGIFIHTTAGRGDVGFCGHWTMEISVLIPIRVYPGMPIGQLTFHAVQGEVEATYDKKRCAKYIDKHNPRPTPSRMYLNFNQDK